MATSIIPSPPVEAFTPDDAAHAALYNGDVQIYGRMAVTLISDTQFVFERRDHRCDTYSYEQMRCARWWRLLPPRLVMTIEAWLYDEGPVGSDLPVCYVARSDRKAGGRLIPGTRLSVFFEGDDRTEVGGAACSEARKQFSDAGLFYSDSIENAERSLSGIDVHAECMELRMQAICAEQASIRALLGVAA